MLSLVVQPDYVRVSPWLPFIMQLIMTLINVLVKLFWHQV